MEEVKILHISPNLSIDVIRKDIKNMHLAVYPPTGRVRIATPFNVNDEAIRLFAISKIAWIRKQQGNFKGQDRQSYREFKQRESHYYLGKRFLLRITEHNAPTRVEIKTKSYIELFIHPNSTIEQRKNAINEWYRAELKKIIPEIIEKWESKIGVKVSDWQVKQMKTKWGTCNIEAKRIWVNLELVKKPIHSLEYIIVHEMIHLIERYHNDKFLALMEKHMPKWKFYKEELNKFPLSTRK